LKTLNKKNRRRKECNDKRKKNIKKKRARGREREQKKRGITISERRKEIRELERRFSPSWRRDKRQRPGPK
jgi:hypothetical protein